MTTGKKLAKVTKVSDMTKNYPIQQCEQNINGGKSGKDIINQN